MSIHHRIILAALAALALGAIPASAMPIGVNGNGYVVRAQTAAISGTPVPPILPAVKASQLATTERAEQRAGAYTPPKGAQYSNAEINAYRTTVMRHITPGVAGVATPQDGFEWGDAGIGAAAGFVLAVLGLGAALVISQRRPRRGRHNAALTS